MPTALESMSGLDSDYVVQIAHVETSSYYNNAKSDTTKKKTRQMKNKQTTYKPGASVLVIVPCLKRHRINQQHSNPALESYSLAPSSANAWL
jgi:hypothetical protein